VEFVTTQETILFPAAEVPSISSTSGFIAVAVVVEGVELAGDTIDGSRIMLSRFNAADE